MGVIDRIAGWAGYVKPRRPRRTAFPAADVSRLTASLTTEVETINLALRNELRVIRARSRQAAKGNPHVKRFVQMVVDNVCGPKPFVLQAKIKYASGKLDGAANKRIELAWQDWGRVGSCEVTGRYSWGAVQRLFTRTLAVDGELLLREIRPGNKSRPYRLQLLDPERLDTMLNKKLPNGGVISMGVELDSVGVPVAYHLLKVRPRDQLWSSYYPREHERVPAEEIIHQFDPLEPEQTRGVPWVYAALIRLVHLNAWDEAAVIAARVGASQMGFITTPDGEPPETDSKTADGEPQITAEPGAFPVLKEGQRVEGWNPKYPDAAVESFGKYCLRAIASGMGVAYHNLAGDMEGVNYSSARIAELEERDAWMAIQQWMTEHVHDRIYGNWLADYALHGLLPFPIERLSKYRAIEWQARRWAWVDPLKEVDAKIKALDAGLTSRTRVVAETGVDFEDIMQEVSEEQQIMAAAGFKPSKPAAPATGAAPDKPAADDDAEDDPDNPDNEDDDDATTGQAADD